MTGRDVLAKMHAPNAPGPGSPMHRSPVHGLLDYWRRIGDVLAADPLVYTVPGVETTFAAVACDGTELGDDFATYAEAQRAVVEWAARERERAAG